MLIVKNIDQIYNELHGFYPTAVVKTELVELRQSAGRVLAENICAGEDIPHFCRSTVDGWAVRAKDTFGATDAFPAILKMAGEVEMGKKPLLEVTEDYAVYVPTGGWVPEGADAVVMIEFCEKLGNELLVYKPVSPGTCIVFRADDTKEGAEVIPKGTVIGTKEIGTLAALGKTKIPVLKKPLCGIISTGDEIVPADTPVDLNAAKMRDVNSYLASSLIKKWGGEAIFCGIVKDEEQALTEAVFKAYEEYDMVLLSGGSSAGMKDNSMKVIESLPGSAFLTHGLAVKPGKPTILGRAGTKPVIGLPGHPVSAFFIMQAVVRSIFYNMLGISVPAEPYLNAVTGEKIPSNNGRDDFIAGVLKDGIFTPVPVKSGLITLLAVSNGYVRIEKSSEGLDKGAPVKVFLY